MQKREDVGTSIADIKAADSSCYLGDVVRIKEGEVVVRERIVCIWTSQRTGQLINKLKYSTQSSAIKNSVAIRRGNPEDHPRDEEKITMQMR